ncbi:MAG: hypothetical protein IBX43_07120 [Campylobacterales bacterium]|nr:hypothetical protein [Campylobacterales bacterium]
MRFTIDEYARAYSISPEMVHSRLRRNRLNYIIEDDTTYIVVPKHQVPHTAQEPEQSLNKKTTVATVISLYQKENHYLKLKVEELERKVDRLISEKEALLKEERERIEKVYMDKDAQLKTILELINTKLLQEGRSNAAALKEDARATEVAIEASLDEEEKKHSPVELKEYLRSLNLKSSQRKSIKRHFAEAFGGDSRILLKNGLFYLDFDRYDYSDLLKLSQV